MLKKKIENKRKLLVYTLKALSCGFVFHYVYGEIRVNLIIHWDCCKPISNSLSFIKGFFLAFFKEKNIY